MDFYQNFVDAAQFAESTIIGATAADADSAIEASPAVVDSEEEQGILKWGVDSVADVGNWFAGNLASTRDAILDAGVEVADNLGDDAKDTAFWVALGGPAGLALGGVVVAVALNPSLATTALKDLGKIFK